MNQQQACASKSGVLPVEVFQSLSNGNDYVLTVFQGDVRALELSIELHEEGWFAFVNRSSTGNTFSQIKGPVNAAILIEFLEGFAKGVSWAGSIYLQEVAPNAE